MKIKFSNEIIAGLEIKEKAYAVYDECTMGLNVRVLPSGLKTFCVYAALPHNSIKTMTLGTFGDMAYKEAREKAIEVRAKIKTCKNKDEADQVVKEYKRKWSAYNKTGFRKDSANRAMMAQINNNNLPHPHIDMRIKDVGNLIFKYAWPDLRIAIDVVALSKNGKSANKGRELVGRHNAATLLGWDVYLVPTTRVYDGSAIDLISRAIKSKMELSHEAQG